MSLLNSKGESTLTKVLEEQIGDNTYFSTESLRDIIQDSRFIFDIFNKVVD